MQVPHEGVYVEFRSRFALEVIYILPVGNSNLHTRRIVFLTLEGLCVAHRQSLSAVAVRDHLLEVSNGKEGVSISIHESEHLDQLVFVEVSAIPQKFCYSRAKVTERHLSLALEIEVFPDSLEITQSLFTLVLEFLIPISNRSV